MPEQKNFTGDTKYGVWLLQNLEKRMRDYLIQLVPSWLQTYHLTLCTLLWSVTIVLLGMLARSDTRWLWGTSFMIVLQYVTDLLDGEVGRRRNTGLIRWGYYMDHFLDYVFLCSIIIGYSFLVSAEYLQLLLGLLALLGAFMVHAFLAFSATDKFHISFMGMGPTEMRIFCICLNILLIEWGMPALEVYLPSLLFIGSIALLFVVFVSQRRMWQIDQKNTA